MTENYSTTAMPWLSVRCAVVAEVGVNHNGDLRLAHRAIDEAADAGADAVKFQHYRTGDFIVDEGLEYAYVGSDGVAVSESQRAMFDRYELAVDTLPEL